VTLLAPAAGLFGLVVAGIVALYFLKPRRPDVPISSTLLWRRALRENQAAVPWQRLHPSWLFVLQVLAAALIVAALVRPAISAAGGLGGTTVVVVDASESMQATDVHPSRFAVAKARAAALIDRLGTHGRIALVAMDGHPRIVVAATADQGALRRALASMSVTSEPADLQSALQLAVAAGGAGRDTRAVVLSDGITEPISTALTLPFPVTYQPIGVSGENTAITALTVQPANGTPDAVAHVQNFGRQARATTIEFLADGRVVDARAVVVAAGGGQDVTFSVPAGADHVTATLVPKDLLAVDDTATAVAGPARRSPVVVVTNGNPFLIRALALRPDLTVTSVKPSSYRPQSTVDLYVFDRYLPALLPEAPYLLIDPPEAGGAMAPGRLAPTVAGDPLLADVDLSNVHVARAEDLRRSTFGRTVIGSVTGPLLMVQDAPTRGALLGFDLHDSDFPLRASFPILVRNLSEFLDPPAVPAEGVLPGAAIDIDAGSGATEATVTRPDGRSTALPVGPGSTTVIETDTAEVGLYRVVVHEGPGLSVSEFVVNAGGTSASAIAAHDRLELAGMATVAAASTAHSHHDAWPWIALLALVVLFAEWVVYLRVG
jgi:hypothetical protein